MLLSTAIGNVRFLISKKALKETKESALSRFNNALNSVNNATEKLEVCENWIDFLRTFEDKN